MDARWSLSTGTCYFTDRETKTCQLFHGSGSLAFSITIQKTIFFLFSSSSSIQTKRYGRYFLSPRLNYDRLIGSYTGRPLNPTPTPGFWYNPILRTNVPINHLISDRTITTRINTFHKNHFYILIT